MKGVKRCCASALAAIKSVCIKPSSSCICGHGLTVRKIVGGRKREEKKKRARAADDIISRMVALLKEPRTRGYYGHEI